MLNEAFLCGDLEDVVDLEEPEALDVDGSALLVSAVIEVRVHSLNLVELLEVKRLHMGNLRVTYIEDVIYVVFLAPLDEVVEHEDRLVHFELARAQKPKQVVVVILRVVSHVVVLDVLLEHLELLLLLFTHVADEPRVGVRGTDSTQSIHAPSPSSCPTLS